ncbi:hypothetical protein, partial [Paenibacillus polymyxa]|uniref:hypothetical protein n=2 Tax=Paenibacillus polymyxa TaxID=1406 RepID=UPI001E62D431
VIYTFYKVTDCLLIEFEVFYKETELLPGHKVQTIDFGDLGLLFKEAKTKTIQLNKKGAMIMDLERFLEIHRRNIQDKLQGERPRTDEQKQIVVALYIAEALNHLRNNLTMEEVLGLTEIYRDYRRTSAMK